MKSVSVRIAIWSAAVLAGSLLAFLLIARILTALYQSPPRDAMLAYNRIALREAVHIYESQGRQALSAYLQEINRPRGMQLYLTDSRGHDLVSGDDDGLSVEKLAGVHVEQMPGPDQSAGGLRRLGESCGWSENGI